MKKTIILLFFFFSAAIPTLFAQTLHGYAKTLGRLEKKGEALGGVIISVEGNHNSFISKDDGTFSIPMPEKKNGDIYFIEQARKKGYQLAEYDLIGRRMTFSDKVRLEIAMVSLEQLQADKQRIENKAYATVQKNYKAKYDLLEKQLADNEIIIKKYQEEIHDLQSKLEKNQLLIGNIADHYARIDFDTISEKDKEIVMCIENGELERADSLIHLVFDSVSVLMDDIKILDSISRLIKIAQEGLQQANHDWAAALKQQEIYAERFYELYTIAILSYDNKKAQEYIEKRAALDKTNAEWQIEAGQFIQYYLGDYDKAFSYYQSVIDKADTSQGYNYEWIILAYSSICGINYLQGSYEEALKNGHIAEELILQHPDIADHVMIVNVINNLSSYYFGTGDYDRALELFQEALTLCPNNEYDTPLIATLYNNTAMALTAKSQYNEALLYYQKAIELRKTFYGNDHYSVGQTINNMGDLYLKLGQKEVALNCFQEGLSIRLKNLGQLHPDVAESYNNIGHALLRSGSTDEALTNFTKAYSIYEQLNFVDTKVATCLLNLGNVYHYKLDFPTAISYLERAQAMYEQFLSPPHPSLATLYFNAASTYYDMEDYLNAATCIDKAVSMFEALFDKNHPDLYTSYDLQWMVYVKAGDKLCFQRDYAKAKVYYEKALYIYELYIHQDENIPRKIREKIEFTKFAIDNQ